jgi:hemolysin activation/secretion protein
MRRTLRGLPAMALAALPIAAPHAQAPPPLPGVIERTAPVAPPQLGPRLLPPEPARVTGPGEDRRVAIGSVTIDGNTAMADHALRAPVAELEGRVVALAEIESARLALLHLYRQAGFAYVAVGAGLAPLPDGRAALHFRVTEGFIAEVALDGAPIGPAARQVMRFLEPLIGQRPVPNAALERALLLASDIPGVTARGLLRPLRGEPGALQLVVQLERRATGGFLNIDNRGYEVSGAWQGLASFQLNGLTGLGDRTELALFGTEGGRQGFVQLTEEVFLGGSGLRLRGHVGAGRADPGSPLAAIGYAGETQVAGLALSYPIIRSRPLNLGVTGQFDAFASTVETVGQRQSRDAVRALRLGLEGSALDAFIAFAPAAATSTGLLRLSQGIEALGASDGDSGRTARLGSDFGFTRLVVEATRLQPLLVPAEGWLVSLFGAAAAQWSSDVLPPAEKFYLGGNRLGRGFYAGQVSGDRALAGTLELQAARLFEIAMPEGWPGGAALRLGVQFYLFRDEGRAEDNGPDGLDRRLASWGGGVRLQFDDRVQLDLEGVRRITRSPEGAGVRELDENALFARVLLRF